ncbi:MAG: radical SAM family heme chaperone HemW [Pseudomonadales bacterium]|jgi:oxygen-independent coproporphyrinogen-3 oxidase|nr:radical SAM family heme chaperone HemW [Pseudomonadales bacterium]
MEPDQQKMMQGVGVVAGPPRPDGHPSTGGESAQATPSEIENAADESARAREGAAKLPPLSLYVHVPWCLRKCPYCDFNSHQRPEVLPETDYIAALLDDLRTDLPYAQGRELVSIFFGGGTPSLFSAASFTTFLDEVHKIIPCAADIEITLEANPGTFEQERFNAYRRAGINRLSIGIQSFEPAQLLRLGRVHDRSEALRAADIARRAGFDNFNLDLMFGLPGQNLDAALADLRQALACAPTHVSWYQLTIEPNTEFYRRPPTLPGDENVADMQEAGITLLAEHGFVRYEISAYAQANRHSRHNRNYWEFGDYLGIGAGAHGKFTGADGAIHRTRKTLMPSHYLRGADGRLAQTRMIPVEELPFEFLLNALRLREGVPAALFSARTGLDLDAALGPALTRLRRDGLLVPGSTRLCTTPRGYNHLNTVLERLL